MTNVHVKSRRSRLVLVLTAILFVLCSVRSSKSLRAIATNGISSNSHSDNDVCFPDQCGSPYEDVAIHVPPYARGGKLLIPGYRLVATDLYGKCYFGESGSNCESLAKGDVSDKHVLESILTSLQGGCFGSQTIDLGANIGQFTSVLLSMGCTVTAVEPQRPLQNMLISSAVLNGFSDRLTLYRGAVAEKDGEVIITALWVPGGMQNNPMKKGSMLSKAFSLDGIIRSDVKYLKIDIDGPEARLLAPLQKLTNLYNINNVMTELTLKSWPKFGVALEEADRKILEIFDERYTIFLTCETAIAKYPANELEKLHLLVDYHYFEKLYIVPRSSLRDVLQMNNWSTKNLFFSRNYNGYN
jgi:FkbM family methyltransferase